MQKTGLALGSRINLGQSLKFQPLLLVQYLPVENDTVGGWEVLICEGFASRFEEKLVCVRF